MTVYGSRPEALEKTRRPLPDQGLSVDELEDVPGHVELRDAQLGQERSPNQACRREITMTSEQKKKKVHFVAKKNITLTF